MEETNKNFFQRNMGWIIAVAVIVILVGWGIGVYNSFVRQNIAITAQWAQVENQYQRRFDLIPNLVNTVKGFASHEQAIYDSITSARAQYAGAQTTDQKAAAATQVEGALGRLLVIAESNPAIQSAPSFRDLSTSLEGTENRISVERMKYNDLVKTYNTSITVFPGSIFAGMFGFSTHEYFNVPTANQANPVVNFTQ